MLEEIQDIKIEKPVFPENDFNIKDFGGVNDGKFDNTEVIKSAIGECAKAGGGRVVIPEGRWFTKAIHFKSNVNIYFEDKAVLIFSDKFSDYLPVVFSRWEGVECYNYSPLIYANGCENIALTGNGLLEGNGEAWWHWKKLQHPAAKKLYHSEYNKIPLEKRVYGNEEDALRPYFVQLINCKNVIIEGLTFINGPMWTISPVYCENVTFNEIKIFADGPNTDGINPESSKNVLIENCYFETGDDCIAIDSGMNEDGWRVNKSCENIIIRNCVMNKGHSSVALGSAVSGGIKNVFVHDCKFSGSWWGIRMKTMPGRGGFVKNVFFENIEISNQSRSAIELTAFYPSSSAESTSNAESDISGINIKNIFGENNMGTIVICGSETNHLKDLRFENINLAGEIGFRASYVDGLLLENVKINAKEKPAGLFESVINLKSDNFSAE